MANLNRILRVAFPGGGGGGGITLISSQLFANVLNTNSGSKTSITLPGGTTFLLAFVGHFIEVNGTISGGGCTFTKGSTDTAMSAISGAIADNGGNFSVGAFSLAAPDLSGQFTWDWAGTTAPSQTGVLALLSFSGVTSVRGGVAAQSNAGYPLAVGTLTAVSGDKALQFAYYAKATGSDPTAPITSWTNGTIDVNMSGTDFIDAICATAVSDPSGNISVGPAACTGGTSRVSACAVALTP